MAKPLYYYGVHAVSTLLQQRSEAVLTVFVQQGRTQDDVAGVLTLAEAQGISVQRIDKDKLSQLCHSTQHQGVAAQARPPATVDPQQLLQWAEQPSCLFLVLDQITDPHNVGACLRSAAAMGVDAVICPKHHAASITPAVAKVAVGAAELVPVVVVTNLAQTLQTLKQAGVFVYGTALGDQAQPIANGDYSGKVALVMGAEGSGMRRLTADLCDQLVYLPMPGRHANTVQSLNVSVATGIGLYAITSQRQAQHDQA